MFGLNGDNLFEKANEAKNRWNNETLKEEIKLALSLYYNEVSLEAKLENLREKGAIIEAVTGLNDAYYVTKDNMQVTVYENGDILDGQVSVWGGPGNIECPVFKNENGVINWYIYTAGQLEFLANFENDGDGTTLPASLESYANGYSTGDTLMTANATINLMNNIDLGARPNTGEITINSEITDETEKDIAIEIARWEGNTSKIWTPIGNTKSKVVGKLGTFDGNGYTIKGMYANIVGVGEGLFGVSNSIKHLTIKDSFVMGNRKTAGISAATYGEKIEDCHNVNTTVIGTDNGVGGIIGGTNTSNIINCTNSGKIIGRGVHTGGIAGAVAIKELKGCINTGNITGGVQTGGIVGTVESTGIKAKVVNCNNFGNIKASGQNCRRNSRGIIWCRC